MTRPAQRRELAEKAVATKGVSIAQACRAFGVSETCFRYSPKRDDENEMIADLLVGLTNVHKTWGFGLCFLHLRNNILSRKRNLSVRRVDHAKILIFSHYRHKSHIISKPAKSQ